MCVTHKHSAANDLILKVTVCTVSTQPQFSEIKIKREVKKKLTCMKLFKIGGKLNLEFRHNMNWMTSKPLHLVLDHQKILPECPLWNLHFHDFMKKIFHETGDQ